MTSNEIFWTDEDYEDYEEQQERAKYRNRIQRLQNVSFSIQHEIWLFFSIAWFRLLSEIRGTQKLKYSSDWAGYINSIKTDISKENYGPLTNDELIKISESISKDKKLSANLNERKAKLFNKNNEVYSFLLQEKYNEEILPYHKVIKALALTWAHEVSYRECKGVPVWNYVTFYYTCIGFGSTLSRSIDKKIGKIGGHRQIWSLYTTNALQIKAIRENIASPFNELINNGFYNNNRKIADDDIVPFFEIIREFQSGLFNKVSKNIKKNEKGHFFHFIYYFSEFYRYKNILPVLFSKNPKYSLAEIQLSGLCDYLMIWLESFLIQLLSPELIEFFMYNFICRNEKAISLKERYQIYQKIGKFPQKRIGKIPYGGHEILDELIRISDL